MREETKQNIGETVEQTIEAAEEIVCHPLTKRLARFGFLIKGGLFIVIGVLAILATLGVKPGKLAGPGGALAAIAQASYGRILLIIFIIGAVGHGVWNILRGVADVDEAGGGVMGVIKRGIAVGVGIFYLGLAWTSWEIVYTAHVQNIDSAIPRTLTSIMLALPFGVILVLITGLSVIGAGIHECYSGVTGKFRESFKLYKAGENELKIITILGLLSFTARALIFGLMGYFFITAAIYYNPNEAVGLDGALWALALKGYGKILLLFAAVGLLCHGILALYEAKYRRIS